MAETRSRIAELNEALDNEVENARNQETVTLKAFAGRVAVKVNARSVLQARLARLDPTYQAPPLRLADDVHGYIRSIKRWKNGNELRRDLGPLIKRTETNPHDPDNPGLAEVEQSWLDLSRTIPSAVEHKSDLLNRPTDELLRRGESIQGLRQELSARLDAYGRPADRAKLVAAAVAAAGRPKVLSVLEPSRYVHDSSARLVSESRDLSSQISRTDPESRAYRDLVAKRDRLDAKIQEATVSVADARHRAAEELLAEAEAGDLPAIAEIETLVGAIPGLAEKLNQARGTDAQLVHVVADLIKPRPPEKCSRCGR